MNSKKIILFGIGLILICQAWILYKVYNKEGQIAYIDTAKLMSGSKQMQSLRDELKSEGIKVKSNLDTLSIEFQNALKIYEKKLPAMTVNEKELSKKLLKLKQDQLVQYQQAIKQKAVADEQKRTQEILLDINNYIKEYGISHNYKIILATAGGNIAFADTKSDITSEILIGINN